MAEKDEQIPVKEDKDIILDTEKGDEGEENVLQEHCNYFNKFMDQLRTRGKEGLSRNSLNAIKNMKLNMNTFLNQEETVKRPGIVTDAKTGAISKNSKAKVKQEPNIKKSSSGKNDSEEGESEEYSDNGTSDSDRSRNTGNSSDGDSEKSSKKKDRKTKKCKKTSTRKKKESLAEMLIKLDNRQVPRQEKFNEDDGQDLEKYLDKFDKYCKDNFKGDKDFWIGELEHHLSGKTLENFKALKCYGDSYKDVKEKLISWYEDEKELRKNKYREKFKRARPKSGENLFMFSNRLEGLFKLAYTKLKVETSETLMAQFQAAVSKQNRELIRTQIVSYKIEDKRMRWTALKKWARVVDVEREKEKQEESTSSENEIPKPKEIVINLSKTKRTKTRQINKDYDNEITEDNNKINYSNQFVTHNTNQNSNINQPKQFYQHVQRPNNYNYQPQKQYDQINHQQRNGNIFQNSYNEIKVCNVCKRFGHIANYCRVRLNTCFLCGDENHFIRNCPKYYKNKQQHKNYSGYQQFKPNQYQNNNKQFQPMQRNYFQHQRSFSLNRELRGESPTGRRSYSQDNYRGQSSNRPNVNNNGTKEFNYNNYNQNLPYQRNQNGNNRTDQQERKDLENNNPQQKNLN